jgi:hypothetical protein
LASDNLERKNIMDQKLDDPTAEAKPADDDLNHLYIVQLEDVGGSIFTQDGEATLHLRGELLLYGEPTSQGDFTIQRLRRLTLYGAVEGANTGAAGPVNTQQQVDPLTIVSLVGPDVDSKPEFQKNAIDGLVLQLHYRLLSYENPLEPRWEKIQARLTWDGLKFAGQRLSLENVQIITGGLLPGSVIVGYVSAVQTEKIPSLVFALAGSGEAYEKPLSSIPSHCGAPLAIGLYRTVERRLPIRFVNLSSAALNEVERLCEGQLVRVGDFAACPVWRGKAALNLVSYPNTIYTLNAAHGQFIDGSAQEKSDFSVFDDASLANFLPFASWDYVEVYLVDELIAPLPGGGVTQNGGITYFAHWPDALILLEIRKLDANPRLLAHELCHVLGLDHPDGDGLRYKLGSLNSIAVPPTAAGVASPARNTFNNISILIQPILNPIVHHTTFSDYWIPD